MKPSLPNVLEVYRLAEDYKLEPGASKLDGLTELLETAVEALLRAAFPGPQHQLMGRSQIP